MDLEGVILNEVNQRNIVWHPLYVESKHNEWNYLQNRKRLTDLKNEFMAAGEKGQLGTWEGRVHIAIFKMDNQQGPIV